MLFTFDVSFVELWQHICHAGYWLIPILGIWIVVYGLNAFAWQAIIKGNCKEGQQLPSFWRIYRLTITGYALNYATPVGGLGGEPYRIMELSKDIDNQHATSSVILYAMMHFFAHFWFWFISIFIYLALVLVGDMPMTTAIAIVLGTIILFCLVAFYIFSRGYRHGLVVYVLGLIGRLRPGVDLLKKAVDADDVHAVQAEILLDLQIQGGFQGLDAGHFLKGEDPGAPQPGHRGEGNPLLRGDLGDGAGLVRPAAAAVHDDHFAVDVGEGAKARVSVAEQLLHRDHGAGVAQGQGLEG